MITVTNAATAFAFELVSELIRRGVRPDEIVGVSHDARSSDGGLRRLRALGAQIREADLSRPEGLGTVFAGTSKLLLVPYSGNDNLEPVGEGTSLRNLNALAAAKETGAGWVGYVSGLRAQGLNADIFAAHKTTEDAIVRGWPFWTFLRNGLHVERYASPSFAGGSDDGRVFGVAGDGRISAAARADYASAAAEAAVGEGHIRVAYELAGEQPLTVGELTAVSSELSGQVATYVDLRAEEYGTLLGTIVPADEVQPILEVELAIRGDRLHSSSTDLRRLLGRAPTAPLEALSALFARAGTANQGRVRET